MVQPYVERAARAAAGSAASSVGGAAGRAIMSAVGRLLGGKDELLALKFWVEVDGVLVAGFTECSGLQAEVVVEEYEEGGLNTHVHKLPGRVRFNNVTLRAGVANAIDLWKWFNEVGTGQVSGWGQRKHLSIVLYNSWGDEMVRWNLMDAYPVRWTGPDLTSEGGGTVAVQALELAHNGFYLA